MADRLVVGGHRRRRGRPRSVATVIALAAVAVLGVVPAAGAEVARPTPARQVDDGPQLPVDPDPDPARTRRTAEEILEGEAYQPPPEESPGSSGGRSLLDRIRDWLGDRIPNLEGPGEGATDLLSVVLVAVLGAAAVAVAVWAVRAARRSRGAPDDADELDADVEITPLRSPSEWSDEAERCEARGDHRAAVRARFRAVTATLVARDLVVDSPGRTAGELRIDLDERAPEATAAFGPLADHFERVWYGSADAGPDDSARARALADAALAAAPAGRRPAVEVV